MRGPSPSGVRAEERLAIALIASHPEDAARLLDAQEASDVAAVLAGLPPAQAARVYHLLGPSVAAACAEILNDDTLAPILAALPAEALVAAVRRASPARRPGLIASLPEDRRRPLDSALRYPEDSAAAIADPFVLTLAEDLSVGDAQRQLKGSRHAYHYLYVVARGGLLVGALAVPELLAGRPRQGVASLMRRDLVRLAAHTDLATVAAHPAWRDFDALPVVDDAGRLIGAIRHKTVRHLRLDTGPPVVETIVRLSEMYWVGLSGILNSLSAATSVAAGGQEGNDVT